MHPSISEQIAFYGFSLLQNQIQLVEVYSYQTEKM